MFNFSLKFRTLMMKLDVLWLLFDEIDLTIGFGRVELGWVSFCRSKIRPVGRLVLRAKMSVMSKIDMYFRTSD